MAEHHSSILTDANSNELKIVEFSINDAVYGINVAKVREIIKASIDFVPVPDTHPSIKGAINLRGAIIPVVDLARHLKMDTVFDARKNRIIIAEFNRICLGFLVGTVSRIHRLSWKNVEVPSQMMQTGEGYASGIVRINEKVIFLLDFEKVASHINPRANIQSPQGGEYGASAIDRSSKKVLVVDDSDFTRQMIVEHLQTAGYQTETATNGEEAWQRLSALKDRPGFEDIGRTYNMMVTDIEMPQMDGLHLIKKIKEEPRLRLLPCIAFSSIISKEVIQQCKSFGADGEISKPEIGQLVALVDAKAL
jgi:two-component system, chemotaxis family, chemotaxis protein CheV